MQFAECLSLSKNMQAVENRARQGGKPANEEAYFPYVTEICRRSQRSKQNREAILRLRDFFDGLRHPAMQFRRVPCFFFAASETGGKLYGALIE